MLDSDEIKDFYEKNFIHDTNRNVALRIDVRFIQARLQPDRGSRQVLGHAGNV